MPSRTGSAFRSPDRIRTLRSRYLRDTRDGWLRNYFSLPDVPVREPTDFWHTNTVQPFSWLLPQLPNRDFWELYDLQEDPHEMKNVYDDPTYSEIVDRMRRELVEAQTEYEDTLALRLNGF